MKVLSKNRVSILDHRTEGYPRAMDLVRKPGGQIDLEMKGKGKWSIDLRDASEQIRDGIDFFNHTPM